VYLGIPLTEVGQVDSTKPKIAIKKVKVEPHDGCFGVGCLNPWLRTDYPYKCEAAVLRQARVRCCDRSRERLRA
jgi:hypothetical protein